MLRYVRWDGRSALPSLELNGGPAKVLVVADLPVAPELRARAAQALVREGARYVCTWGTDCEAWHDAVDLAEALLNREAGVAGDDDCSRQDGIFVMTTWHAWDPLEDAMHFYRYSTSHPDLELAGALILHVSNSDQADRLLALYGAANEESPVVARSGGMRPR